jgi:hypothetical protein
LEKDKPKIKAPGGYDNVKNTFQGASVNTFDGFRLGASKQVNLNTMVSHFYWIGSQNVPPIYQYRLILPFEDGKLVNISTDVEFSNIDGEFKVPLDAQSSFKLNLSLPQEGYQVAGELELNDESSTTQVSLTNGPSDSNVSVSYMQSVTPFLALGGIGNYSTKSAAITRGFAGTYNDGENMLVTQWDNQFKFLYQRRVNPNRFHLNADVQVDEQGNSTAALGAEYILKQSRLQMSIDSNIQVRSVVEVNTGQGFQLQFSGDLGHLSGTARFGFGLMVG